MPQHRQPRHAHRSAVLIAVLFTFTPHSGHTDEVVVPPDEMLRDELRLLKEEQPFSLSSSEPYVMTEDDIRESGAADLPELLRKILGVDDSQAGGSGINRPTRADNQRIAKSFLVEVDGHSTYVDASDSLTWVNIPVTLPEIKRLEMWKEPASPLQGTSEYHIVVKITTKTSGK